MWRTISIIALISFTLSACAAQWISAAEENSESEGTAAKKLSAKDSAQAKRDTTKPNEKKTSDKEPADKKPAVKNSESDSSKKRQPEKSGAAKSPPDKRPTDKSATDKGALIVPKKMLGLGSKRDRQDTSLAVTPAREAAALMFVKNYHEELLELLSQLKSRNPAEYEQVLRELFRTSEKLASLQETDAARYELALEGWKLKSRIQLLVARASLSSDKSLEVELRAALEQQAGNREQTLQFDRDQIAERLKKIDAALAEFQQNRTKQVERQYEVLLRGIQRTRETSQANATAKPVAQDSVKNASASKKIGNASSGERPKPGKTSKQPRTAE